MIAPECTPSAITYVSSSNPQKKSNFSASENDYRTECLIALLIEANMKGCCVEIMKEIDIFKMNMFWNSDACRRKIDDALDASANEIIGRALGTLRRCSNDADLETQLLDLGGQLTRAHDLHAFHDLADLVRIAVKSAADHEALASELAVAQKSAAQVAHADKGAVPGAVDTERAFDGADEVLDVVADTPDTEFAEVREILAYL